MNGFLRRGLAHLTKSGISTREVARRLNVSVARLNYIVHVDPKHRTVYFETPKVACTTIKAFLQEAMTGELIDNARPQHLIHDRKLSPLLQINQLTGRDRQKALYGESFSRIGFVRHPVNRFVSAFQDKYLGRERAQHLKNIGFPDDADVGIEEVLQRLQDIPDEERDIHFATQHHLLGSNSIDFDFIGRFETLSEDLRTMAHRFYSIDAPDLVRLEEYGRRHSTASDAMKITDIDASLIQSVYRDDFERFGYQANRIHGSAAVKTAMISMEEAGAQLKLEPALLNYLVHVDPKHRTVYFETPKVACSAIKALMHGALTGELVDPSQPKHLLHERTLSPLLQLGGMEGKARTQALFGEDIFRFSFVRHPVSRFISAYTDKYFGHERAMHLQRIGLEADANPSMLEVLRRLKDYGDHARDIHFMSQNALLGGGEVAFDFIGRFEMIEEDLGVLFRRAYRDVPLDLKLFGSYAEPGTVVEIGSEETHIIHSMYREDFDRFGYLTSKLHLMPATKPPSAAQVVAPPKRLPDAFSNLMFSQDWFRWKLKQGINLFQEQDFESLRQTERELLVMQFIHLLEQSKVGTGAEQDLVDFFAFAKMHLGRSNAQILQDLWVLFMTDEKHGGYFVEFGACDGVSISNTLLLEREFGWSGILAEPNPIWAEDLRRNRQVAIDMDCVFSETGETIDMQCVIKEPELSRIDTIVPNDVHERTGNRSGMKIVSVQTVSLNDLLARHNAPQDIDFMSIDTEGSEYEILKTFDFNRYNVRLFAIENAGESEKQASILELMTAHGYKLWYPEFSRWDDWYYRP